MKQIEREIKKLKIVEKAWCVVNDIEEPWFYDLPIIIYAKSAGEAKSRAVSELAQQNVKLKYKTGEDINFLDIRLSRKEGKKYDKCFFNGEILSKQRIVDELKIEKRDSEFDKLLSDNPNAYAYILKGGYYYGANSCGYTEYKESAGIYTLKEAVKTCKRTSLSDYMRPELINIEEHNNMINKKIKELELKIIK